MKKIFVAACFCFAFLFSANNLFAQTDKPKAVINHLAIFVVDLQKSGDFYENVIGFDTIPEPFHDGKHIWLHIGPNCALHIIEGAEEKKEYYKNNHICFSVASVEAFTQKLQQRGISYEDVSGKKMSITTRVDGVKQIWLQDPDGYWIEINDAKY